MLLFFTGDADYKPYVSSEPDVTTVEMNGSEDFLIIACDGLWDTVNPAQATQCVFQQLRENKGKAIVLFLLQCSEWFEHFLL